VDFCAIFSGDNRKGTHPPDLCLQGSGDGIVVAGNLLVGDVEGRDAVPCRYLVVQAGPAREYFLYTYKCGREYTASFWRQQTAILVNGLLNRNSSGALIRYSTRIKGDNLAEAKERCAAFVRATIPSLDRSLP
jgi:EpsI family protein